MPQKRISERFALSPSNVKVDREKGVITGVRLCGESSANGRRYLKEAFRQGLTKYAGAKSYCDHSRTGSRSVRDLIGGISEQAIDAEGLPQGTLTLYLSDPVAAKILEIAEKNPAAIGLSHVADCRYRMEGGIEVIEEILHVESVDVVVDPATTKGLFESKTMKKITLKTLSERIGPKLGPKKWAAFERLLEMDDAYPAAEMPEPAEDATADASIEDAVVTLVSALTKQVLTGDSSVEDAGQKFMDMLNAHLGNAPSTEGDDEDSTDDKTESKKKKKPATDSDAVSISEALDVASKIGFRADRTDLTIIAAAPIAEREAVARRLKITAEGEKPRSGAPAPGGKPTRDGGTGTKSEQAVPTEVKDFKAFVTAP